MNASKPTQLEHPNRAALRTGIATTPPLALLLPVLVEHLGPELAAVSFLAIVAGAALSTRLFASDTAEHILLSIAPLLAAGDRPRRKDK